MAFLFVLCLFAAVFATPIAPPAISSFEVKDVLTNTQSYAYPVACQIGQYAVIAGGYTDQSVDTNQIDVIDLTTNTRVSTGTLAVARSQAGTARFEGLGVLGCLVVGGITSSTSETNTAELIVINPSTGAVTTVQNVSDYFVVTYDQACVTLSSGSVYCAGGYVSSLGEATEIGGIFNGTDWVQVDLPEKINFDSYHHAGTCVTWGNDVWCCGGLRQGATNAVPHCIVLDTTTLLWSNFTVSARVQGTVALVPFPTPHLVIYGGYNATGAGPVNSVDVISKDTGAYVLTTTDALLTATNAKPSVVGALGNVAFDVSFASDNAGSQIGSLFAVYTESTPVVLPPAPASLEYDAQNGYYTTFDGSSVAVFANRVVVFGGYGYDSDAYTNSLYVFEFSCPGRTFNAYDTFIVSEGYIGCDKSCTQGYYGINCDLCVCNGQGCMDGVTGNGTCICAPNYYGADCSLFNDCSGQGVAFDGIDGDGSCVCNSGYNGTACQFGPFPCGGTWDPATGSCTCPSGFYGSDCSSACACGANGLCKDGTTGTGECVCAPGTYSVAGAATNCSQTCNCGTGGTCDDGNYGTGSCFCAQGTYGANCVTCPTCAPVVESPDVIQIFRCDDGVQGTGECIRLYNSASLTSAVFGLVALCFSFLLL